MIDYLRALAARLRGLFRDRKADQELEDEIKTHLRLLTERYVRRGMTEAEAAWAARRQFGNVTLLQEVNRESMAHGRKAAGKGFRPLTFSITATEFSPWKLWPPRAALPRR